MNGRYFLIALFAFFKAGIAYADSGVLPKTGKNLPTPISETEYYGLSAKMPEALDYAEENRSCVLAAAQLAALMNADEVEFRFFCVAQELSNSASPNSFSKFDGQLNLREGIPHVIIPALDLNTVFKERMRGFTRDWKATQGESALLVNYIISKNQSASVISRFGGDFHLSLRVARSKRDRDYLFTIEITSPNTKTVLIKCH